jgi:hypothetical protein
VANSSASTGVSWAGPSFLAGRNKIINGDFNIWQRGTSFTLTGTAYTYTADRFDCLSVSGQAASVTRTAFTPGTSPVAGYEGNYYLSYANADTSIGHVMRQKIENVTTFAGQTVTVSFWAKINSGTKTLSMNIVQDFGTGGSSSAAVAVTFVDTTLTTSWKRFIGTAAVPSIVGKTIGTNSNLNIPLQVAAGNGTLDTWGWQVEAGSVASPFTTATGTLQGELAACQRYYQRFTPSQSPFSSPPIGNGIGASSTRIDGFINLMVAMRIPPSALDYSGMRWTDQPNNIAASTIALGAYSQFSAALACTSVTGVTQYRPYQLNFAASTDYLGFTAEL